MDNMSPIYLSSKHMTHIYCLASIAWISIGTNEMAALHLGNGPRFNDIENYFDIDIIPQIVYLLC